MRGGPDGKCVSETSQRPALASVPVPTAHLDTDELRELHPAGLMLECAGIRHAPPYDVRTLNGLHAANARLRAAATDPVAAAVADDDFHRTLTERCGNARLLAVLESLRRRLAPYKRAYLAEPARVERSAKQHDAILCALARGDHPAAESRLRQYLKNVQAELVAQLEQPA